MEISSTMSMQCIVCSTESFGLHHHHNRREWCAAIVCSTKSSHFGSLGDLVELGEELGIDHRDLIHDEHLPPPPRESDITHFLIKDHRIRITIITNT
jgi:hypothetical protein